MPTSIRLDPAVEQRLDLLAQQTGRTKAFYLRELIERNIDDLEDFHRAHEIAQRVRDGKEKVHTLDDVERELGLGD